MICYPEGLSSFEICAVNEYWLLSDKADTGFLFAQAVIDKKYKDEKIRKVGAIAKKTLFLPCGDNFFCRECGIKMPVSTRSEYLRRCKTVEEVFCDECIELIKQRSIHDAIKVVSEYKNLAFEKVNYISDLAFDEILALLSMSVSLDKDFVFLSGSPSEIFITGCEVVDQNLFWSLVNKGVFVYLPEIPKEVELASELLYGSVSKLSYDGRSGINAYYKNKEVVCAGVYLNKPSIDGVDTIDLVGLLYQRLSTFVLTSNDVRRIKKMFKDVQIFKLYKLVDAISREYRLPIDNSRALGSLLNHLAENYSPVNLYFTFNIKAKDVVAHIRKEGCSDYVARHYFTSFVGNYIERMESRDYELVKTWSLPPEIISSPFESVFSDLYLNQHFNWNRLSVREIVASWLDKVNISDDADRILSDCRDL
ncbi:MAG: hypothetical protein K6L75_03305 [Cellvibrionaceae bacterium]|nr:hypothetical protein [Motiliproteus sp.]MCW9052147.1 hypothetical protein [Motiliproteus sp.]